MRSDEMPNQQLDEMIMKETLLTRKDDSVGDGLFDSIAWAFSEHLKTADTGVYNAAILYGNEDAPEMIDFFTKAEPLITDHRGYRWSLK